VQSGPELCRRILREVCGNVATRDGCAREVSRIRGDGRGSDGIGGEGGHGGESWSEGGCAGRGCGSDGEAAAVMEGVVVEMDAAEATEDDVARVKELELGGAVEDFKSDLHL
jgi:hypothetical protein